MKESEKVFIILLEYYKKSSLFVNIFLLMHTSVFFFLSSLIQLNLSIVVFRNLLFFSVYEFSLQLFFACVSQKVLNFPLDIYYRIKPQTDWINPLLGMSWKNGVWRCCFFSFFFSIKYLQDAFINSKNTWDSC